MRMSPVRENETFVFPHRAHSYDRQFDDMLILNGRNAYDRLSVFRLFLQQRDKRSVYFQENYGGAEDNKTTAGGIVQGACGDHAGQ